MISVHSTAWLADCLNMMGNVNWKQGYLLAYLPKNASETVKFNLFKTFD